MNNDTGNYDLKNASFFLKIWCFGIKSNHNFELYEFFSLKKRNPLTILNKI